MPNIIKAQCPFCQWSSRQDVGDERPDFFKAMLAKGLMLHLRLKHAPHDAQTLELVEGKELSISTVVSSETHEGKVDFTFGEETAQFDIPKAKLIRDMLSEAIEAAISDAVLMRFMLERVGLDADKAAHMLMDFREIRQGFRGVLRPN